MKPGPKPPSTFFSDDDEKARPIYGSAPLLNGAEEMLRQRRSHKLHDSRPERPQEEERRVSQPSRSVSSTVRRRVVVTPVGAAAIAAALVLVVAGMRFASRTSQSDVTDRPRTSSIDPANVRRAPAPPARSTSSDLLVAATTGRGSAKAEASSERAEMPDPHQPTVAAPSPVRKVVPETKSRGGGVDRAQSKSSIQGSRSRVSAPAPSRRANQPVGTLVVNSRPQGANVSINGVPQGKTPVKVNAIQAGSRVVRLDLPGYEPWSWAVNVMANQNTPLSVTLQRRSQR